MPILIKKKDGLNRCLTCTINTNEYERHDINGYHRDNQKVYYSLIQEGDYDLVCIWINSTNDTYTIIFLNIR